LIFCFLNSSAFGFNGRTFFKAEFLKIIDVALKAGVIPL